MSNESPDKPYVVGVDAEYTGGLRCRAVHGPSGAELLTDAPIDNHGKGAEFSPTDLVGTALATCVLTIMGMAAERHDIDFRGARARVEKTMSAQPPRRIARLALVIEIPGELDAKQRRLLEAAAKGCPVHRTLTGQVELPMEFRYGLGRPGTVDL